MAGNCSGRGFRGGKSLDYHEHRYAQDRGLRLFELPHAMQLQPVCPACLPSFAFVPGTKTTYLDYSLLKKITLRQLELIKFHSRISLRPKLTPVFAGFSRFDIIKYWQASRVCKSLFYGSVGLNSHATPLPPSVATEELFEKYKYKSQLFSFSELREKKWTTIRIPSLCA